MRALTVVPGDADSVGVREVPEPSGQDGSVLVETVAVGLCGTDAEILAGRYGSAPPGSEFLIVGHESLGRVLQAPPRCGLAPGDMVVGIVRRPDPVPCPYCAIGEWDMCNNGRFTERGIKGAHGFAAERFCCEPSFLVPVGDELGRSGVLVEPTSVVAKAWEQVEAIGRRSAAWDTRTALVCGAGPVGLLAALLGVQRGYHVHIADLVDDGPKPQLAADLGATYHDGPIAPLAGQADVIIECTGAARVVVDVLGNTRTDAIVCLTGVSSGSRSIPFDVGTANREIVLGNTVVFGSVNANRRHYDAALVALAAADPGWLGRLVTCSVPLDQFTEARAGGPSSIKSVLTFDE